MRLFLIIIILLITVQTYSYPRKKNIGNAYIFGNSVNIREKPSINSKVIIQLGYGDKITIVEKTDVKYKTDLFIDYWYKIKVNNKTGYCWGALIADLSYILDMNDDKKNELILIRNHTKGIYTYEEHGSSLFSVCVMTDNKKYKTFDLEAPGEFNDISLTIRRINNLDKPEKFISMKYNFSGDVGAKCEKLFLYKNEELIEVLSLTYGWGEGGQSCLSNFIFPDDKDGKKNIIIELITCMDLGSESSKSKKMYKWNGEKFIELK